MKSTYFLSDVHLGIDGAESSKVREKTLVRFLNEHQDQMEALYFMGDLFDFWFEYKKVIPKGGVRILSKLAELNENGIQVHFFTGNHDQWMSGYFEDELGIRVYHDPITVSLYGKKVMMGHGDGLGPGDHGYKFIKKLFRSQLSRSLFSLIPPGIGIPIARFWSGESRQKGAKENVFLGADREWLIQYCESMVRAKADLDYYLFAHRHVPIHWTLSNKSTYINLGDWLVYRSFVLMNDSGVECRFYNNAGKQFIINNTPV